MPMHDIDRILAETDLPALADQLVGGRRGNGTSAKWPSPVPGQQGTGDTPPMGIFIGRDGTQRWKDFSTGQGGTAIDLIKTVQAVDTKTAIETLARNAGIQPEPAKQTAPTRHTAGNRPAIDGTPRITQWVQETNAQLALPKARLAHRWLAEHGIDLNHAIENSVGYDPGSARLKRGDGLPKHGPAIVLPITDQNGDITYAQSRQLRPGGAKYLNPASTVATNPTISILEHQHHSPMILTEGIADALVLTQHGHNAAALIGTGIAARDSWIDALTNATGDNPIVLAFDNDPAGHQAAQNATDQLTQRNITPSVLTIPASDLSEWANLSAANFPGELTNMLKHTATLAPNPDQSIAPSTAIGL